MTDAPRPKPSRAAYLAERRRKAREGGVLCTHCATRPREPGSEWCAPCNASDAATQAARAASPPVVCPTCGHKRRRVRRAP